MYSRLELLRDLLRDDGPIWVTMDDNEAPYLKVLMDEISWKEELRCERHLAVAFLPK